MRWKRVAVALIVIGMAGAAFVIRRGSETNTSGHPSGVVGAVESGDPPLAILVLQLSGVGQDGGPLKVAVFDSNDGFPNHEEAVHRQSFPVDPFDGSIRLDPIPPGSYAIAVYQDVDSNGKMNRALAGYPTEPYGFSNDARSMFGPPPFSNAVFEAIEGTQELHIEIK